MSVINTMLADLESRQVTPASLAVDISRSPDSPKQAHSLFSKKRLLGFLSITVFVGVYILGSLWFEPTIEQQLALVSAEKNNVQHPSVATATSTPAADKVAENQELTPALGLIEEDNIATPQVLADMVADAFHALPDASNLATATRITTNDAVDRLLAQAELALLRERLTQPVTDNAYDRYQQVLAIEPNNQTAIKGIEKIQQRYLQLIAKYMKTGDRLKVERYSLIARQVGVAEQTLEQWLASYQAENNLQINKQSQQTIAVNPVAAKTSGRVETFQASWQTREQQLLRQLTTDASASHSQKITVLQNFIQQNPEATLSRQQLLVLFITQQQWDQAQGMIDQSAKVDRIEKDLWQAQLWHAQGQWSPLIERLSQSKYTAASYPQQVALRAAALHQLRNYERSVKDYAELVKSYPQQATYWLGLALGLDALANGHALAAFQQTKLLTRDNANYLDYVNQRITALAR